MILLRVCSRFRSRHFPFWSMYSASCADRFWVHLSKHEIIIQMPTLPFANPTSISIMCSSQCAMHIIIMTHIFFFPSKSHAHFTKAHVMWYHASKCKAWPSLIYIFLSSPACDFKFIAIILIHYLLTFPSFFLVQTAWYKRLAYIAQ